MKSELKLHRLFLEILAGILAIVILVFFYFAPTFADARHEAEISLVAVLVVAAGFVYMGTAEGIIAFQFGTRHKQELVSYLLLGALSIASGLYLAISDTASVQTIALVVSPHAFIFGVGELRLAQHVKSHPSRRTMFLFCGICELAFGLTLVAASRLSNSHSAVVIGYVASLTTLQLLGFLMYRNQRQTKST
ncbi:hypothetical protein BH10ACI4_BH10ACI4_18440 [soil metagenome]